MGTKEEEVTETGTDSIIVVETTEPVIPEVTDSLVEITSIVTEAVTDYVEVTDAITVDPVDEVTEEETVTEMTEQTTSKLTEPAINPYGKGRYEDEIESDLNDNFPKLITIE